MSANSVTAFYQKTRHFFIEIGVYQNILQKPAVRNLNNNDIDLLRSYHLERMGMMRSAIRSPSNESHLKESCWRALIGLQYFGQSEAWWQRIEDEQLRFIKGHGPIGGTPRLLGEALTSQLNLCRDIYGRRNTLTLSGNFDQRKRFCRAYIKCINDEIFRNQVG
ncbi:hypothetical protein [uncultured Roseibium sp.]|uniref:hypothetical protein n=1 Tax=uncultured Roseibium sp. TaxID=1936171 RepID=UPI0026056420|nr:hypothetical protein [uncultured Roseibium sp.]